MKLNSRGQLLPVVIVILTILTIMISGLVSWIQHDSKWAVKSQKSTTAISFAETGLNRGTWKLQSTTTTWNTAANGTTIANYDFDKTFDDIPGGTYRIRFSSGPSANQVTVTAEGRDVQNKEVRAIRAVYENQTIYSAMMSGGVVTWGEGLGIYWGPIMSQGDIQLSVDNVARRYFPRKYAKGTVLGTAANPRDTNGLTSPNTDNVEWWSNYSGVPGLPLLDFTALRSSAAASGTLNVYGCRGTGTASINGTAVAPWDTRASCPSTNPNHAIHLGNSTRFYAARGLSSTSDYVWYWDGDVSLEGTGYNGSNATSLRGTIIVRGNLTIDSSGDMVYSGRVPTTAWQQQRKLLINTFDSAAAGEYPADLGLNVSTGVFRFGTDSWCEPGLGCGWVTTVGIKGFVYVGGNLNVTNFLDINGAIWVNGNVVSAYSNPSAFCGVMYDDTLNVPALNVILLKISWQEVTPNSSAWP